MSNLTRLLREQAGQMIGVCVTLLERIVLTGMLYRTWGHGDFEKWSACTALAGFISVFEFGFNLYFNNRITVDTERRNLAAAKRHYDIANTVFLVLSLVGFMVITAAPVIVPTLAGQTIGEDGLPIVACIAGAAALRLAACGASSLYRANKQYSRLTIITAASEVMRIAVTVLVVALGGGVISAAVVTLLVTAAMQWAFIFYDTRRRFHPHRIGLGLPNWEESAVGIAIASGYFAQNVPLTVLAFLPVLVLARHGHMEGAGALAIFVLMRTLTGLPRAILQALGIVSGQECGRRLAGGDQPGAMLTLKHSGRAFAALSGIATGLLLGAGSEISVLWTGSTDATAFSYLVAGAIPMVLAPLSVLAHNVAASTNEPFFAALGRWAQIIITLGFYWIAPIDDPGLRMLAALAAGEVIGFSPLAYYGMARSIPGARVEFHVHAVAITILATLVAASATAGVVSWFHPEGTISRVAMLMLAGTACAITFPWLGLDPSGRSLLLARLAIPVEMPRLMKSMWGKE
jgi:O-antigen/teichoic acid export membrane protein